MISSVPDTKQRVHVSPKVQNLKRDYVDSEIQRLTEILLTYLRYEKFNSETEGCVMFHSETKGYVKFP
jgi:hypothetical protein